MIESGGKMVPELPNKIGHRKIAAGQNGVGREGRCLKIYLQLR